MNQNIKLNTPPSKRWNPQFEVSHALRVVLFLTTGDWFAISTPTLMMNNFVSLGVHLPVGPCWLISSLEFYNNDESAAVVLRTKYDTLNANRHATFNVV